MRRHPRRRSNEVSGCPHGHRASTSPSPPGQSCLPNNSPTLSSPNASAPKLLAQSSSAIACRARAVTMARPWPRSISKRSGTSPCPRGHREVAGRSPTWSPHSRHASQPSKPSSWPNNNARLVTGRERERANQLVTTQDRMVAELEALHSLLEAAQQAAPPVTSRIPDMARDDMSRADPLAQSMRSLLEAAQQAARPVTPRTWREMTWSERWRWLRLRTTGSERLTDRDLKATDQLKAVLECMKEEAGFGKPTAPTARPGDGAESKIIRW